MLGYLTRRKIMTVVGNYNDFSGITLQSICSSLESIVHNLTVSFYLQELGGFSALITRAESHAMNSNTNIIVWPLANHLTSIHISFFTCILGLLILNLPHKFIVKRN